MTAAVIGESGPRRVAEEALSRSMPRNQRKYEIAVLPKAR
ncbi:hypothetical protein SNARM312S_02212 [Streptomyces narbonensis]